MPVVCGAAVLAAQAGRAQDSHYWSIQYGPIGQQLGGQVVGSARDLSAAYYNPGGLGLAENPHFLLSVQGFRVQSLSIESAEGGSLLDKSQTDLDDYPGFFAFAFPRGWLGEDTRLAFSLLTRQQYNARVDVRVAATQGGSDGFELLFDQRMSETWGGLTVSHRLSDQIGIGATLYGVYRSQRTRWEQSLQLADFRGVPLAVLLVDDFKYSDASLLGKVGVAWEGRELRLGLAVTTPRASVFGGGSIGYTRSVLGADLDGNGTQDPILANGFDDDLDSTYKSSWAVAGGGAWRRDSLQLHLSAEWFAATGRFNVLEGPADAARGENIRLVQDLHNVFNVGVGVEYWLGGRTVDRGAKSWGTVLFGAAATDFSASPEAIRGEASINNQNWYHLTGGVGFSVGSSRLSVGVDYAFGSEDRDLGDLGLQVPGVPEIVAGRRIVTRQSRWVVILGYLFGG